jgi:propanol-preferring alcohol dehydrogenase
MKAMLLKSSAPIEEKPLTPEELPEPIPAARQVRLKVSVCGICHTDLHTVEGELELPRQPLVPGHQVVGTVDMLGEGVTRFKPGERAGMPWLGWTCGKCKFCKSGRENLCEQAKFNGLHFDGGYGEYALAYENFAYPIPEGFPDVQAAPLLCAGIIGYRALRLSDAKAGDVLGMYGFGASAHVTIQVARHLGIEVFVFTRAESHRKHAKELGATWVGGVKDEPPKKLNAAIMFAPAGKLVPEALRVMDRGATLALAGIYMTPIPEIDYNKLLYHERTIRSVANFTRADAEELLKYAAEIPIHTETQTFPLKQANEALIALKQSQITGCAVLRVAGQGKTAT